jgi:tRNA-Thr(GGU) m(6)t(6)A37 methyltransferase TsaA
MHIGVSYYMTDDDLLVDDGPQSSKASVTYSPIGHVATGRGPSTDHGDVDERESTIILDPRVVRGLSGLTAGDRLTVIFHLDRSRGGPLMQHPRGDAGRPQRGVFALRSPHRPNPIGISVVEIVGIEGNTVRVRGLDALDGTPVLDLKPTGAEAT